MDNPIAVDLATLVGQRVDSFKHHGFMVWGIQRFIGAGYPWIYVDDSQLIY